MAIPGILGCLDLLAGGLFGKWWKWRAWIHASKELKPGPFYKAGLWRRVR
jgi:hypothetical protein